MATAGTTNKGRARFTAACGVLSWYVKEAAEKQAAEPTDARSPAAMVALPLMPGADVSSTKTTQEQLPGSWASQRAQMTIVYSARVLVLDDVPADRAAELLRFAASSAAAETVTKGTGRQNAQMLSRAGDADMPVARKASLQRFMEKRKGRIEARAAPYLRPDHGACTDHLSLSL